MTSKTVMIMAGGTGGHIYPALAVADNLTGRGFKLLWLGTNKGLEATIVPDKGYPLLTINVTAIRGKGFGRLVIAIFKLLFSFLQALVIMIKIRPTIVLGMGGFASGPGGIAALLMRVPLLIHEQNSVAGLTNRLLSPFAAVVMAGFPDVFKRSAKLVVTGNPVRKQISNIEDPRARFSKRNSRCLNILILGGSLGAKSLNEIVPTALYEVGSVRCLEIKHQCGKQHLSFTESEYKKRDILAEVVPFFEDIAVVYNWADLVICRAGALTVAEIAACGIGSILIPYPYAVDDHQTKNAEYLATQGAAILIQEAKLNVAALKEILLTLIKNPEQLLTMAMKARALSKPKATNQVAELCMEAAYV